MTLPHLHEKRVDHLKKRFQRYPEYHTLDNQMMTSLFDNNYAEILLTKEMKGKCGTFLIMV